MSNTIQAEYEQLEGIAGTFGKEADNSTTMTAQVRKNYEALKNGGWLGRGADAFFNEMEDEILPTLEHFFAALEKGQSVTQQIVNQIHQAEEEAAGLFKGNGAAATGATGGGMGAIAEAIKSAMEEAAKKPPRTGMEAIAETIKSAMEEAAQKQTAMSMKEFAEVVKKFIEQGTTNPTPITIEAIAEAIKTATEEAAKKQTETSVESITEAIKTALGKVTTGANAVGTLGIAPAVKALEEAAKSASRADTEAKIGAMIKSALEEVNKNTSRADTEAKIGAMIKSALEEVTRNANGAGIGGINAAKP